MLLSVVVPIYNSGKYLSECISSILSQDFVDIEVILVDDGSTDNSANICQQFVAMDSRVVFLSTENQGPFEARKKGVFIAKGEYVTFVDADDFIAKKSYSKAIEYMKQDVDIICFNITRYFSNEYIVLNKSRYLPQLYKKKNIEEEIYPNMIWDLETNKYGLDPSTCTKLFKKSLLLKTYHSMTRYDYHYGEDVAIVYFAVYMADTIYILDDEYYYHRMREPGVLPKYIKDDKYLEGIFCLYNLLKKQLPDMIFSRQIECFYITSVLLRQCCIEGWNYCGDYVFPFDKVKHRSRVVIYGAGKVGNIYIQQVQKIAYCTITAIVDKNAASYNRSDIYPVEKLIELKNYDYIVVAVANEKIKNDISNQLCCEYGINKEKII